MRNRFCFTIPSFKVIASAWGGSAEVQIEGMFSFPPVVDPFTKFLIPEGADDE